MPEYCACFNVVKNNNKFFVTLDKRYIDTVYDLNCFINGNHICTVCDRAVKKIKELTVQINDQIARLETTKRECNTMFSAEVNKKVNCL